MRRTLGLAAVGVLAAGTLGVQTPGASGAPGTPGAAGPGADGSGATARDAVQALAAAPGQALGSDRSELTATDTMVDADGTTHVRMRRTHRGLPVLGGDLVVHQDADDTVEGVSQTLDDPLRLSVEPVVSATAAQRTALAPAKATRSIRNLRAGRSAPRLVVDALGDQPRLAWEITTRGRQADGTPSRLSTYVDARTGQVIRRVEGIQTVDGDGQSLYSGNVSISVQRTGDGYTLTDVARGDAATTDMQNQEDGMFCRVLGTCTNGVAFTSPDPGFGDGTTGNRESAAVDAHYGSATTYDYYQQVHGRAGVFGDGTGVPSRVHYGRNYVNAFWDGEKMTYGDGDGQSYGPLVSLDVAGHEMTHGVTQNTADLTYSGESGGLNEATSDIFGAMVEFYAGNAEDPGDYFVGEEFDLARGEGLRRMDDPASDGSSYSCYEPGIGNADVHYSSGVGNHFFYLLAEGSGPKTIGGRMHSSPTCDGSTLTGIGRDKAADIWFRALTRYFTSGTTYAEARTGTVNAAEDLYGSGSAEAAAVAAAWDAVDVS